MTGIIKEGNKIIRMKGDDGVNTLMSCASVDLASTSVKETGELIAAELHVITALPLLVGNASGVMKGCENISCYQLYLQNSTDSAPVYMTMTWRDASWILTSAVIIFTMQTGKGLTLGVAIFTVETGTVLTSEDIMFKYIGVI